MVYDLFCHTVQLIVLLYINDQTQSHQSVVGRHDKP